MDTVNPKGITVSRSAEHSHCVVITVDTDKVDTATVALEFALQKHPSRFLTIAGKTALSRAHRALPVHSLVNYDSFIAAHASAYCNSQSLTAQQVHPCLDSPPFVLHIKTVPKNEPTASSSLVAYGAILGGIAVAILISSTVRSHIKID